MHHADAECLGRQKLPIIAAVITFISMTSAQLQGRPPWELAYQIDPSNLSFSSANSPYQLLPQQQVIPQQPEIPQTQHQQLKQQPNTAPTFTNPSANLYRKFPIEIPKAATQQPPSSDHPQDIPNPQVQSSQQIPQQLPPQNLPFFQQPSLYNFQPYPMEQESSFEPKVAPDFSPFAAPPLLQPPPPQSSNPIYPQNQIHQLDDLQRKLQLQFQITQQIQQQIEQLQKLQELNRQSISQSRKLIDQSKQDIQQGGSSQERQNVYQPSEQNSRQRFKSDSQEIYTQQSIVPQSTIANLQFASPINALQGPPQRFSSSPLFIENVTDSSLPYYLVAPSLNSVSFFDRLPNGRLEGRSFLPQTLDLTTVVPNTGTATPPGIYGESVSTVTSNEVHTPTEVPSTTESTDRNGIEAETASVQRRTQLAEETTISPKVARERLQNSFRRFVTRG